MFLMWSGLLATCLVALLAVLARSQHVAVVAIVFLAGFTIFFEPWYCFAPFEPEAYQDPDVVLAAAYFRVIGIAWIVTCLFVLLTSAAVFRRRAPSRLKSGKHTPT